MPFGVSLPNPKKVLKAAATTAVAGTLGVGVALATHPKSPVPKMTNKVVQTVSSPFRSDSDDSDFYNSSPVGIQTINVEKICPDIVSRPTHAPSHFIIQLGGQSYAIPSNAIPANAIPSNYIPSNFRPNAAIPSNAIPANVISVIIQNYAIPSNFIEPNTLASLSPTYLSDMQQVVDLLEITRAAIPANALPASVAPDVKAQFAIPSNALPASAKQLMNDLAIPSNALPDSAIPSNVIGKQLAIPAEALPSSALPAEAIPAEALPASALPSSALPSSALPSSALPASALPASMTTLEIETSNVLKFSLRDITSSTHDILTPCQSPYQGLSTNICGSGANFSYCNWTELDNSGERIIKGSIIFNSNLGAGVEYGTASGDACDEQFTSLTIYPGGDQLQGQLSIFVDNADAFDSGEYRLLLDPPGETFSCQFVRVNSTLTDATRLICTGPQVNVTASRASLYPAGENCEIAGTAINLPGAVQVQDNSPGVELGGPPDNDDDAGAELAGPDEGESASSSSENGEETGSGGDSSSGSDDSGDDVGVEYGGPACGSEPSSPDPSEPDSYPVYEGWCSCMGGELQYPSAGSEAPPSCNLP
ncbi:MAG: hypothetical protein DWQ07_19120 [Chloroflexi bacterium]|nr:MAG: hypothetical protein DWQ07_19120 [Chloroflexota bacterium]MBL1195045.1 hypothetical protein [Chloroflexota bacterium]NOH12333.1 hypothetical protein [Chloroflexota bacterium]